MVAKNQSVNQSFLSSLTSWPKQETAISRNTEGEEQLKVKTGEGASDGISAF